MIMNGTLSIRAGIATVRNVSPSLVRDGLRTARLNFLRSPTSTSFSPCRKKLPRSRCRTRRRSTAFSLPDHPRRDSENHLGGPQTPRCGNRLLCRPATVGDKTSTFIRTCIASCPAADRRLAVIAGFPRRPNFFLPVRVLSSLLRRLFMESLKRTIPMPANFSSSAPWKRSRRGLRSPGIWKT